MHLALIACGIGKGDEVILPDLSWIASASVITYVGATPVFVDVSPITWCISPVAIEEKITNKTKAIMPVHLYGYPSDMRDIMCLAKKYNLKVIEDAAPSLGAEYDYRKTGSFGDFGAFSFQGAKLLSTGEGGMLVTDDDDLFAQAKHFSEHGRRDNGFVITDIGYKYKMSNIQAAWGLAQLERIDELLEKRYQIYQWYKEELEDVNGIQLSKGDDFMESPNHWMTSIVLNKDFDISRNNLMKGLRDRMIDTRPFFPPISSFRMFKNCYNTMTMHLSKNGINLPSGHKRTHEDIVYVCDNIKDILGI
jgi:perosamine synthetase